MADKLIRALIVEDDPSWQQILSEILTDSGLQVDIADTIETAVEKLREAPHRLAILDLSLGGTDHHNQDGLRVVEDVRRYDPNCVTIFLTGFATVEFAVQVMQAQGAFTCLRKEVFRRAEFRTVISQALIHANRISGSVALMHDANSGASPTAFSGVEPDLKGSAGIALVVEDDAGWRSLLTELLEDAGYKVAASSSYVEAFGMLKRERFGLAVMDLSLASSLTETNLDGYRLLNSTHKANIPTIVVSGYADPSRIEKAYADRLIYACLEKQAFDRKTFTNTVKNVKAGLGSDPVLHSLTDREREVLVLVARGMTNKEIAHDLIITPNTVKRHLKSLFLKLEVNTRSAASAKAISMGVQE